MLTERPVLSQKLAICKNHLDLGTVLCSHRTMIGKVLWFDLKKGYGFVKSEGQDYFVHYSKIIAPEGEFRQLEQHDIVEFDPFVSDRGAGTQKLQAINVRKQEGVKHETKRKAYDHSI